MLMLLQEATPSEIQHGFAEIAPDPPDAIMVADIGELIPYRQLIVELVEKSRLPAMYGLREFVDAGGLMAYPADFGETARRIADDVHEILNGANPGRHPDLSTDQIPARDQSESRQGTGPHPPARTARGRRRGNRMRRREFAIGLLLTAATRTMRAQEPAKQHRIAIIAEPKRH